MSIEVREAEPWEGSDCAVCVPKFDGKTIVRPEHLYMVFIGRDGGNISVTMRLCAEHRQALAATLRGE